MNLQSPRSQLCVFQKPNRNCEPQQSYGKGGHGAVCLPLCYTNRDLSSMKDPCIPLKCWAPFQPQPQNPSPRMGRGGMRRRPTGHSVKPQKVEMLDGLGVKPSTHLSQEVPSSYRIKGRAQRVRYATGSRAHSQTEWGLSPLLHKARLREEDCLQGPQ